MAETFIANPIPRKIDAHPFLVITHISVLPPPVPEIE
jgi:hypothetical protein